MLREKCEFSKKSEELHISYVIKFIVTRDRILIINHRLACSLKLQDSKEDVTEKIKVLIIDSYPIYAIALVHILSNIHGIEVSDNIDNKQNIIDKTKEFKPDIVVFDLEFQNHAAFRTIEVMRETYPEVKVIILAPLEGIGELLDSAMKVGAKGLLPRTINPTELVKGIMEIANGGTVIYPKLIPRLLEKVAERSSNSMVKPAFTTREKELMELVAMGKSNGTVTKTDAPGSNKHPRIK